MNKKPKYVGPTLWTQRTAARPSPCLLMRDLRWRQRVLYLALIASQCRPAPQDSPPPTETPATLSAVPGPADPSSHAPTAPSSLGRDTQTQTECAVRCETSIDCCPIHLRELGLCGPAGGADACQHGVCRALDCRIHPCPQGEDCVEAEEDYACLRACRKESDCCPGLLDPLTMQCQTLEHCSFGHCRYPICNSESCTPTLAGGRARLRGCVRGLCRDICSADADCALSTSAPEVHRSCVQGVCRQQCSAQSCDLASAATEYRLGQTCVLTD